MSKYRQLSILLVTSVVSAGACNQSSPSTHTNAAPSPKSAPTKAVTSVVDQRTELATTLPTTATVVSNPLPVATEDIVVSADDVKLGSFRDIVSLMRARDDLSERDIALLVAAAAEQKPQSAMPAIEAARSLLRNKRLDSASKYAEMAVDIDNASSYGWNTMGRVEMASGDIGGAVESFSRAVEENEDNSYAWNNLGLALLGLERYAEAADALENATGGSMPKSYMWNNLGMAYEHLNRFDLATAAYRQSIDGGSMLAASNLERLISDGHANAVVEDLELVADESAETEKHRVE